jgi:hypothetical protein
MFWRRPCSLSRNRARGPHRRPPVCGCATRPDSILCRSEKALAYTVSLAGVLLMAVPRHLVSPSLRLHLSGILFPFHTPRTDHLHLIRSSGLLLLHTYIQLQPSLV